MRPRSLALTTELALALTRGRITDRGDYIVVETPDDPGYYYGNLLVLPAAPQVGEVGYWTRRFTDELGKNPAIRHVTLWWDGITGDAGAADELRAAGFTIETSVVMTAEEVTAPPRGLEIRELDPDQVLETAELAWAIGDRHDERYREFLQRRATWHRDLVARRIATFWGVHDGGALVASLGLVRLDTVARYQDVQTALAYRRRGYAGALLAAAAADGFSRGIERVVIIALPGSDAERVYTRIGFRAVERTASACRYPPSGAWRLRTDIPPSAMSLAASMHTSMGPREAVHGGNGGRQDAALATSKGRAMSAADMPRVTRSTSDRIKSDRDRVGDRPHSRNQRV